MKEPWKVSVSNELLDLAKGTSWQFLKVSSGLFQLSLLRCEDKEERQKGNLHFASILEGKWKWLVGLENKAFTFSVYLAKIFKAVSGLKGKISKGVVEGLFLSSQRGLRLCLKICSARQRQNILTLLHSSLTSRRRQRYIMKWMTSGTWSKFSKTSQEIHKGL